MASKLKMRTHNYCLCHYPTGTTKAPLCKCDFSSQEEIDQYLQHMDPAELSMYRLVTVPVCRFMPEFLQKLKAVNHVQQSMRA